MNHHKTLSILFGLCAVSLLSVSWGQDTVPIRAPTGIPPEILAEYHRIGKLKMSADDLLAEKRYAEAVTIYSEVIKARENLKWFSSYSGAYYGLARAYTGLGRNSEALEAYRHTVFWGKNYEQMDLTVGGQIVSILMDHAILLAKSGRVEDAKTLYYAGLRRMNRSHTANDEPSPLLVVFDPDPAAIVWTYTPQRLEAAALMAKAIDRVDLEFADAAHALAPDWVLPVLQRAFINRFAPDQDAQFALATSLAKTAAERDAIQWAKGWDRDKIPTDRPRPYDLRRGLKILEDSRKWLEIKANRERVVADAD